MAAKLRKSRQPRKGELSEISENPFRQILDFVADGIFSVDTEGRIVFANPAACRILGFKAEELL